MVIERYWPIWGGAENQLRHLNAELRAAGHDVEVVTRRWSREALCREAVNGVSVRRLGMPIADPFGAVIFSLALTSFLLSAGRRYDLFHSHGAAALGALCSLAARLIGGKNISKIATAGRVSRLAGSPPGRLLLALLKRSDAIVCLSREIENELKAIGMPPNRLVHIPNAVDGARFRPFGAEERVRWRRNRGFGDHDPVVVFSGRLVPRKGPEVLLQAWQTVVRRFPEARLILLGSGCDQADSIELSLRQTVAEHSSPNVTFEGAVNHPESYLGVADIFVLPSWKEGMPNALLEAMAAGVACVATRIGGVEDLVEHRVSGILFLPGDVEALAGHIEDLIRDPKMRRRLAENGQKLILQHYSWPAVRNRYEDAYGSLCDPSEIAARDGHMVE